MFAPAILPCSFAKWRPAVDLVVATGRPKDKSQGLGSELVSGGFAASGILKPGTSYCQILCSEQVKLSGVLQHSVHKNPSLEKKR